MIIDERRYQRQQIWKITMLAGDKAQRPLRAKHTLCCRLPAEFRKTAETLAHQPFALVRRFRVSQSHVFRIPRGNRAAGKAMVRSASSATVSICSRPPRALRRRAMRDRPGNHMTAPSTSKAAFEVLAGDVFESLPARHRFTGCLPWHCPRWRRPWIDEMRNQTRDGVTGDDGVGIDPTKSSASRNVSMP